MMLNLLDAKFKSWLYIQLFRTFSIKFGHLRAHNVLMRMN